jgi:hypothetical protein
LKPENKNQKNTGSLKIEPVLKKPFPLEKIARPGWLRRFLGWIAKGADKLNMGKALCPT